MNLYSINDRVKTHEPSWSLPTFVINHDEGEKSLSLIRVMTTPQSWISCPTLM